LYANRTTADLEERRASERSEKRKGKLVLLNYIYRYIDIDLSLFEGPLWDSSRLICLI